MNILSEYKNHCKFLKDCINKTSENQKKELILSLLEFYFLLPDFEETIKKFVSINLKKDVFISNIKSEELSEYRLANKKSIEEIDEYSENYEEPESIEILMLNGFDSLLIEDKNESVFNLFNGIIEILDFYENFSDRPDYWNKCLDKEMLFQRDLLIELKNNKIDFDISTYYKIYKDITFENV